MPGNLAILEGEGVHSSAAIEYYIARRHCSIKTLQAKVNQPVQNM